MNELSSRSVASEASPFEKAGPRGISSDRSGSRWHAELALRFARRAQRTVLTARHHRGPLLVQRPFHPEADGVCHTYVIHPPAGIVGGDDLMLTVEVEAAAHALITTPAATRWHFSRGVEARATQRATLVEGATLEWLPQETLLFDGAHARTATQIYLERGARFCGWEILGLGRPACDEPFRNGCLDFRFELFRDGQPLLLERLRGGPGGLPGLHAQAACATLVATPADGAMLERARAVVQERPALIAGATLIGDVLVTRALAAQCEPLVTLFKEIWAAVRPALLGRAATPPRIWRT